MSEKKDESVIPKGHYCYEYAGERADGMGFKTKRCPYWSRREGKEPQQDGFCAFLGRGDWEESGLSLLWDQVKECGVNMDDAALGWEAPK